MKVLIIASTGDVTKIEKIWWALKRAQHQVSMSPLEKLDASVLSKASEEVFLIFDGAAGLEYSVAACRRLRSLRLQSSILVVTERQGPEVSAFLMAGVDDMLQWPQNEILVPLHLALLEQSRQKLRESQKSEARESGILDALPDLHLKLNPRGILLEFCGGAGAELPFKPDKFVGRLIGDALPGAAPLLFSAMSDARGLGKTQILEFELPSPHQPIWQEARVIPRPSGEFLVALRDITEQKRREIEQTLQLTMLEEARSVIQSQADLLAAQIDDMVRAQEEAEAAKGDEPQFELDGLDSSPSSSASPQAVEELVRARDAAFEVTKMLATQSQSAQDSLQKVVAYCEDAFWESPSETVSGILEKIRVEAQQLMRLFNDLSDFALVEVNGLELRKVSFELVRFLKQVSQQYTGRAREKKLELKWSVHDKAPRYLEGDTERLKRVLDHLIENAIRCTAAGQVQIEVKPESDSTVVFSVSDSGPGIPAEKISSLFSSSENRLGLPLCSKLVDSMGGRIWVESQVGRGTTFLFNLPSK